MSQSRLEKVGTIYSRMRALLEHGARRREFTPLWMDVYERFPPRLEPRWDRPGDESPLQKILYREDRVRAQFHRQFGERIEVVDMMNAEKTLAQRFVERFSRLEAESPGQDFEELFREAMRATEAEEGVSLAELNPEAAAEKRLRDPKVWRGRFAVGRARPSLVARGEDAAEGGESSTRLMDKVSFADLMKMGKEENKSDSAEKTDK